MVNKHAKSVTPSAPPTGTPPLYPELPAGPAVADVPSQHDNTPPDQYFWLQEISKLRKDLEDERDKRSQLYKKYQRGVNAVDAADTTLISASVGMGIGGVGLLSTIIAAPVVLGLEIAALACGLLGVTGKFILAESKLNTIADHVSTALADGTISYEEFCLVAQEAHKYAQMKAEIRAGAKKAHAAVTLDEETKKSLIQRGRDEARASFMKKLAGPWGACSFGTTWHWCVTASACTWARSLTQERHRHKVPSMTPPPPPPPPPPWRP